MNKEYIFTDQEKQTEALYQRKINKFARKGEVEEFYEKELLYYTGEFLLLRGQFYLTMKKDEERALLFFKRAELIGK
jgi:hypothetical protein